MRNNNYSQVCVSYKGVQLYKECPSIQVCDHMKARTLILHMAWIICGIFFLKKASPQQN